MKYCLKMADMGFSLGTIAEKNGRNQKEAEGR